MFLEKIKFVVFEKVIIYRPQFAKVVVETKRSGPYACRELGGMCFLVRRLLAVVPFLNRRATP
jgi:hypothetical protein